MGAQAESEANYLAIIEKNYQLKQTLACPHLGRYNVFQALRGHAEHPLIAQFVVRGLADHEANRVIPQIQEKMKDRSTHFIKVLSFNTIQSNEFCLSSVVLNVYTEYYEMTLRQLIEGAKLRGDHLPPALLTRLIKTLAFCSYQLLEANRFFTHLLPEYIFFDGQHYKVFESFRYQNGGRQKYFQKDYYLEPNLLQCYEENKSQVVGLNPYSVNVWAIGVIVLEAATKESPSCLYRGGLMLSDSLLQAQVDKAGRLYGERVRRFLKSCLNPCLVSRIPLKSLVSEVNLMFS